MLAILVAGTSPAGAADGVRVDVAQGQRMVVAGENPSLRLVLAEVCQAAGVSFRFDAPDEAFAFAMDEEPQPMDAVLDRILRGKSYAIRYGDGQLVKSLHVLGQGSASATPMGAAVVPAATPTDDDVGPMIPRGMLDALFGAPTPEQREAAMQVVVESVRTNPRRLQRFLTADVQPIVNALRRYPNAPEILADMATMPDLDDQIRSRLVAIQAGLQ